MSFKLLAIRATEEFSYIKNLHRFHLYQFISDYEFVGNDNKKGTFEKITSITNQSSYPQDLYDLKMLNRKKLNINITAILGKNGSGKSTLLELLYLQIYCLAEQQGYLNERNFNQRHVDRKFTREYFPTYVKNVNQLIDQTGIETYFEIDQKYHVLVQHKGTAKVYELKKESWVETVYNSSNFFYTVVVNYSLYGLNDKGSYFWLHPLFHKNDGYKTPLVLNPYRDAGVIDINSELHLAQTRVLSNLVDERFEAENVLDDKQIDLISFDVDPERIGWVDKLATTEVMDFTKESGGDLEYVFDQFIRRYAPTPIDRYSNFKDVSTANLRTAYNNERKRVNTVSKNARKVSYNTIQQLLAEYILTKIAKICNRYDEFKLLTEEVSRQDSSNRTIRVITDNEGVIEKLLENSSHVTLKLKQAVNAYVYEYFADSDWQVIRHPDDVSQQLYRINIQVKDFAKMVNGALGNRKNVTVQYIPTAMYRPSLQLEGPFGKSPFPQLSSGEQQLLHSIHCILYHVLNIDSLENGIIYENVNLILDEIELYYHPEYQRRFINTLRGYLRKLRLENVRNLNIIFSTHSPFILSDIPLQNVLKLENGAALDSNDEEKTFGSNIHEMLARSFFLNNELIGDFAKEHIELTVKTLTEINTWLHQARDSNNEEAKAKYDQAKVSEANSNELLKRIDIIGERVINIKLKEMYRHIFETEAADTKRAREQIQQLMVKHGLQKKDI
jgi:energy-coupling factor transporter ATP-binding protein EcfA2